MNNNSTDESNRYMMMTNKCNKFCHKERYDSTYNSADMYTSMILV